MWRVNVKIEVSDQNLEEILDFKELLDMFTHFTILTGVDVSLHDITGEELLSHRLNSENCLCEIIKTKDYNKNCKSNMQYAAFKSAELGEPYIYNCGCMIKCSVPIMFDDKLIGSLACGPVLLWDTDDLVKEEIKKFTANMPIEDKIVDNIITNLKQIECDYMTSAAKILYLVVNYICKEESKYLVQRNKISVQQRQIAELLIEKKKTAADFDMIGKRAMLKKYPVDLEKELIAYVQTGEKSKAVSMLNDILSEIFSFSSGNLDIIKAKLFELTATLMRAAVDIGAPLEEMAIFIKMYNKILVEETTFEDLCYLTKEVMESFMLIVYENRTKKQTNQHLVSAINYIKQNYAGDLSLETVANHVYVSSYYLSHLFRDEMDMPFSDYVNKVRMEESKRLLKDNTLKIQEVAELVGFKDSSYFSKAFKKYYGVSPKRVSDLYK